MSNNFNITSAQYVADFQDSTKNISINAVMDGATVCVPIDTANRHYQAILEWVADGNTIADAD